MWGGNISQWQQKPCYYWKNTTPVPLTDEQNLPTQVQ